MKTVYRNVSFSNNCISIVLEKSTKAPNKDLTSDAAEITSVGSVTCTDADKTSLTSQVTSLESAITVVKAALSSVQTLLSSKDIISSMLLNQSNNC